MPLIHMYVAWGAESAGRGPLSRLLSMVLIFVALGVVAQAEETDSLPYHVLTRHLSAFEELSPAERDKVKLTIRVVMAKLPTRPVRLWMTYDGQRYDLPVDESGFVQVPRNPGIIDADPVIESNQPKGTIQPKLALLLQVPDHQRFHYADLKIATGQTNTLIDKAAGLASFLLPSVTGVQFTCPATQDCLLTVHHPVGDEILRPGSDGKIRLSLNRKLDAEDPLIEASVPLPVIEPLTD